MKNRNTNRARKDVAKGNNKDLEDKWRDDVKNGNSSEETQQFFDDLDEDCDDGVQRDCLGKCGGTAVEDNTGSCCEEHEMTNGSCFSEGYDLVCQECPEGANCDGSCQENPSGGEFAYFSDCMEKLRQDPNTCNACPDSSQKMDSLGTCCDPSEYSKVGDADSVTFVCGGENQPYYGGQKIDGFGAYCLPASYDFQHPKPGFRDTGTYSSYTDCTSNN